VKASPRPSEEPFGLLIATGGVCEPESLEMNSIPRADLPFVDPLGRGVEMADSESGVGGAEVANIAATAFNVVVGEDGGLYVGRPR